MLARALDRPELDAALDQWRSEGFAVLRRVASDETLARLRARAEALVAGEADVQGLFFQPDAPSGRYEDVAFGSGYAGPDVAYRKIEKLERDGLFSAWLRNPAFAALATAALGAPVRLYRATLFLKVAHRGSDLPWHQDGGRFWGLDRDPRLQIWTALDDAPPEAGCLCVLPRSHLDGLATPLGGVVPRARVEAVDVAARERTIPARAGDVVLLHNYVWHRSGPNRTGAPRRAFTVSLLDADTRCVRRKRAPRVFPEVY